MTTEFVIIEDVRFDANDVRRVLNQFDGPRYITEGVYRSGDVVFIATSDHTAKGVLVNTHLSECVRTGTYRMANELDE